MSMVYGLHEGYGLFNSYVFTYRVHAQCAFKSHFFSMNLIYIWELNVGILYH